MMEWLVIRRQNLLMMLLVLIVWLSVMPSQPSLPNKQVWAGGWWIEQERQGYLTKTVTTRRVGLPDWWPRFWKVWQWGQSGFWLGVTGGLLWFLISASGSWWMWMVVLGASHKLRTHLGWVSGHCIELNWEQQQHQYLTSLTALTEQIQVTDNPVTLEQEQTKPNSPSVQEKVANPPEIKSSPPVLEAEEAPALPEPVVEMMTTLAQITEGLPIGTNLAMLQFLWMLTSGQLLASRGAIFPALQATGLEDEEIRRAWAAFRGGSWQIDDLLTVWQAYVEAEGIWKEHSYEGYSPVGVDITAFWRPTLHDCPSKHYYAPAGKALPAIIFGMIGRVGSIDSQRIPLPRAFIRVDEDDPSEATLQKRLIEQVVLGLALNEVAILDAGFKLNALHEAGLKRYVVRLATNFVGRHNKLPPYKGKGRKPEYGEKVRPLARTYQGKTIEATPPDRQVSWADEELHFTADIWKNLVLSDQKPGAESFNVIAIHDPRYQKPWLLATSLTELSPQSIRNLYRDRWPVEQLP
ncbi:MAG: hypothetical protein GY780_08130, partial [bacterium]|nr:hypothetical protein [bacterium]